MCIKSSPKREGLTSHSLIGEGVRGKGSINTADYPTIVNFVKKRSMCMLGKYFQDENK
jgi:hypothetical protein